ncbi:AraC family transcriptional regulator [Streptomyces sp. NPDC101234]|uniref:AraC family transcriptional regulator n=1 Tax=Streptomyces sp. NPDC101234 TaxID=3366138 RepID=UPI00380B7C2A
MVAQGSGEHTIDFVTYSYRPGTLLWVRPGQVQRFCPHGRMNGAYLLFTPAFPETTSAVTRLSDDWSAPGCRQLNTSTDYAAASAPLARLHADYDRPGGASHEILRLLLAGLLLHVNRLPRPGTRAAPHAGGDTYARFHPELERSCATIRRAEDYADRLGYTVKTLTRACQAATGGPVKHVIDACVALQAQRLLAHSDEPVAVIARRPGFSEPTDFGKFFTRRTGTAPGDSAVPSRMRPSRPPSEPRRPAKPLTPRPQAADDRTGIKQILPMIPSSSTGGPPREEHVCSVPEILINARSP